MDFLRRLAPPREGDRSRAVPVLPSRFEGLAPLRAVPVSHEAAAPADDATLVEPGPARGRLTAAATVPARPVPATALSASSREPHRLAQHVPAVRAPEPPAVPAIPALRASPAQRQPVLRATVEPVGPVERPLPSPDEPGRSAPLRPPTRVTDVTATPRPGPDHSGARAPHAGNPITPAAVALRVPPAAPPRPVIHVSIDRIDVRAAATPQPAPKAAPLRTAAASVSLADYLRGNSSARRGGAA